MFGWKVYCLFQKLFVHLNLCTQETAQVLHSLRTDGSVGHGQALLAHTFKVRMMFCLGEDIALSSQHFMNGVEISQHSLAAHHEDALLRSLLQQLFVIKLKVEFKVRHAIEFLTNVTRKNLLCQHGAIVFLSGWCRQTRLQGCIPVLDNTRRIWGENRGETFQLCRL